MRNVVAFAVAVMVTVTMFVAASLLWFTSRLHDDATSIVDSIGAYRLAKSAQRLIEIREVATTPPTRAELAGELTSVLDQARGIEQPEPARELERRLRRDVSAYLAASDRTEAAARADAATRTASELAELHLAASSERRASIARTDALANLLAIVSALAAAALAGALVFWVQHRALGPLARLHDAIARFGSGELDARAPETGPAELREIGRRFNALADALRQRREQQLAFMAAAAHDIRNPLGAMQLSVQRLQRDATLASAEGGRRSLALVGRQIQRLERLVTDLVDTARAEAGQLTLAARPLDLRTLVSDVQHLFKDTSARHELRVDLPADPVYATCDEGRMSQVLVNLVSNAIKYSPDGGPVDITLTSEPGAVVLCVADRGVGISESDRARLFEPFQRADTAKDQIPGTGLGLFVSRRIVEAHGGDIEVDARFGGGSVMRVVLPPVDLTAGTPRSFDRESSRRAH